MSTPDVWVLDTSGLIQIKHLVGASEQWALFRKLEQIVERGELSFPVHVQREVRQERHHDTPETWALGMSRKLQYRRDPDIGRITHVMRVAGEVVDANSEGDPADPYVLAHAAGLCDLVRQLEADLDAPGSDPTAMPRLPRPPSRIPRVDRGEKLRQ